jgi:hypothetical protein
LKKQLVIKYVNARMSKLHRTAPCQSEPRGCCNSETSLLITRFLVVTSSKDTSSLVSFLPFCGVYQLVDPKSLTNRSLWANSYGILTVRVLGKEVISPTTTPIVLIK